MPLRVSRMACQLRNVGLRSLENKRPGERALVAVSISAGRPRARPLVFLLGKSAGSEPPAGSCRARARVSARTASTSPGTDQCPSASAARIVPPTPDRGPRDRPRSQATGAPSGRGASLRRRCPVRCGTAGKTSRPPARRRLLKSFRSFRQPRGTACSEPDRRGVQRHHLAAETFNPMSSLRASVGKLATTVSPRRKRNGGDNNDEHHCDQQDRSQQDGGHRIDSTPRPATCSPICTGTAGTGNASCTLRPLGVGGAQRSGPRFEHARRTEDAVGWPIVRGSWAAATRARWPRQPYRSELSTARTGIGDHEPRSRRGRGRERPSRCP